MSLKLKSDENSRTAKRCIEISAYNAGASRAYYSTFQRAKSLLKSKGFDYKSFRQKIGELGEKDFSHGTIQRALEYYLEHHHCSKDDIISLNRWDQLYYKRIRADYWNDMTTKQDLVEALSDMDTILEIISRYE